MSKMRSFRDLSSKDERQAIIGFSDGAKALPIRSLFCRCVNHRMKMLLLQIEKLVNSSDNILFWRQCEIQGIIFIVVPT